MGTVDKAKNKAQNLAGKAKEKVGETTDDQSKKNEGRADQTKSDVKDAGEKVKDAFRR
ncbi:CsbD family protein [Nocardia sp. NPDC023852]|uniref:CsbD family protein n=1 Tax=unclassified Nocardia TaxID=2637762 RepID=UPI0033F143BC|nr:CsbD family protein [Nocardia sp. NBC_00881]